MAEELRIPSSGGGLTRYDADTESKIKIKPEIIIGITIAIIAFEIILRVL
jgi:preprotein translocase subunit Sec61beta